MLFKKTAMWFAGPGILPHAPNYLKEVHRLKQEKSSTISTAACGL